MNGSSRRALLLTVLLAAPVLASAQAPAIDGLAISPDGGKVLVSMDLDGVPNAYALPASGGNPVQLTHSAPEPVWVVSYFPGDERVLYRSGPAGDDDHLFVRELDGHVVELMPGKSCRFLGWTADGRALSVEAANAGSQSRDLFRIATDGYAKTLVKLSSSNRDARVMAVSGDQRYLGYSEVLSGEVQNVRVHDLQTRQDRVLRAGEGLMVHVPLGFSPDGKGLLLLNDASSPFRYLVRLDSASGARTDLIKKDWDVLDAFYSPDGKILAVVAGGDSRSSLELYDAASLKPIALPAARGVDEVSAARISRDGKTLAFLGSGSATPPAVYLQDLAHPGPPRRLFGGAQAEGTGGAWIAGAVVRFASFDRRQIPGILYQPAEAGAGRKVPAVVWVHDGPSGQARLGFDPLIQALARRGYAVFAVNHRGSFGYGKDFLQLDDQRHGSVDLEDCVAARAWLAASGWVDPGRIAIGGAGFGGFLTLAALAFRPGEFAAGVDLFGVSSWPRALSAMTFGTPEQRVLAAELGSVSDPQAGRFLAPRDHAGDIARPLLIVQGGRDTLAVAADAEQVAAAVKSKGGSVELLVVPEAAGSLPRRADRERVERAIADFLDRNLKGAASR
jgi:dipeptidyl aminopeptidase/acylaminoacyl peptidase